MTREKLRSAILFGLKKSGSGATLGDMAEKACDAIEFALAMEQEASSDTPVIEFPAPQEERRVFQPPVPPAVTPSIVAAPPVPQMEVRPRTGDFILQASDHGADAWEMATLIAQLERNTPTTIRIEVQHPQRGAVEIPLKRNIIAGHAAEAVRLLYKAEGFGDDMAAAETIELASGTINLTEIGEKIRASAMAIYRPRPATLVANVPRRTQNDDDPGGLSMETFMARGGNRLPENPSGRF